MYKEKKLIGTIFRAVKQDTVDDDEKGSRLCRYPCLRTVLTEDLIDRVIKLVSSMLLCQTGNMRYTEGDYKSVIHFQFG